MWVMTSHMRFVLSACSTFMKLLSRWIAEIATMEATSFSLRPPKSSVPIHAGRSSSAVSIRETKFS